MPRPTTGTTAGEAVPVATDLTGRTFGRLTIAGPGGADLPVVAGGRWLAARRGGAGAWPAAGAAGRCGPQPRRAWPAGSAAAAGPPRPAGRARPAARRHP